MTESEKTVSERVREQVEEYKAYRAVGTIERFRELAEKAEPKTLIVKKVGDITFFHCPKCNNVVGNRVIRILPSYCGCCGQRLGLGT